MINFSFQNLQRFSLTLLENSDDDDQKFAKKQKMSFP